MRILFIGLVFAVAQASAQAPPAGSDARVAQSTRSAAAPGYPPTRRTTVVDIFHGVEVHDPYRWMEDLRTPELAAWIAAQNALSAPRLASTPAYADARARMQALSTLYPTREPGRDVGGRAFFRALVDDRVQLQVTDPGGTSPRVLLDAAALGEGIALKAFAPSPDGRYVAYVAGVGGADWGEIRIRDVTANADLPTVLPNVRFEGPMRWTADGEGLVYRRFAPPRDGRREAPAEDPGVYLHRLGTPIATDLRLYGLPSDMRDWSLAFDLPGDRQQLFLYVERGPWHDGNLGGSRAQVSVLELERSGHPRSGTVPRVLLQPDAAYRVVHAEPGRAWLFTDHDAPRRRVVLTDLAKPEPSAWRTVIPEGEGVLNQAEWFGGRLVAHSTENVHSVVRIFDATGKQAGDIPLPGTGVVQALVGTAGSARVGLLYSGLLQPPVLLQHDLQSGATRVEMAARGAPDLSAFEVRQEWFASKDGTRVPMFIAARRDLSRGTGHPTILLGYGASSTSLLPTFQEDIVAWLQMGGVYAIANVRGGGEFGKAWYQAAIRERKQTSFDDMIGAAEHLVANGWTTPRQLGILGASNGGLLVTATMLQRPGLFGVVLADVPVTDPMRRHLSGNGLQQVEQWGTPEDPLVFPALRAYSPLHNLVAGKCYPATLVTTSRDDERLPPWHAYKFTAALQAAQGCAAPVLLHVRDSGGHGGGSPDGWMDGAAMQLAFAARALGLSGPDQAQCRHEVAGLQSAEVHIRNDRNRTEGINRS